MGPGSHSRGIPRPLLPARVEASSIEKESIGIAGRSERITILAMVSVVAAFWQQVTAMNGGYNVAFDTLEFYSMTEDSMYLQRN